MSSLALSMVLLAAVPQAGAASAPASATATQDAPLRALPRESLSWTTDGFGQVIGVTIPAKPMGESVRSIDPSSAMPAPLGVVKGASSLRITGKSDKGIERDIAALRWDGPVISWQRMPVPAAAFSASLAGLAEWMAMQSFSVTLASGSVVRIVTEPQMVSLAVGAVKGGTATAALAGFPACVRLEVPDAAAAPAAGQPSEGAGLVSLGCGDLYCRISTNPDTVVDIDVTRAPPQVRVTVQTPSELHLEGAVRELESTEEVLRGAPPDQQAILGPQRAAQQARVEELRKAAASEKVKLTGSPIRACVVDPRTGREYATVMISIVAPPHGGKGAEAPGEAGPRVRTGRGWP